MTPRLSCTGPLTRTLVSSAPASVVVQLPDDSASAYAAWGRRTTAKAVPVRASRDSVRDMQGSSDGWDVRNVAVALRRGSPERCCGIDLAVAVHGIATGRPQVRRAGQQAIPDLGDGEPAAEQQGGDAGDERCGERRTGDVGVARLV